MSRIAAWLCAGSLLLSTAASVPSSVPEAVADHDHHPGLGHPGEGDDGHAHGDADDHHETPDSPCHHHDTHTCCGTGLNAALAASTLDPESRTGCRIPVPRLDRFAQTFVVEFLHVPLA